MGLKLGRVPGVPRAPPPVRRLPEGHDAVALMGALATVAMLSPAAEAGEAVTALLPTRAQTATMYRNRFFMTPLPSGGGPGMSMDGLARKVAMRSDSGDQFLPPFRCQFEN